MRGRRRWERFFCLQGRERSLVLAGCGIHGDVPITHSIQGLGREGLWPLGLEQAEGLRLGLVTAAFQEQLPILLPKEWLRCGFSG